MGLDKTPCAILTISFLSCHLLPSDIIFPNPLYPIGKGIQFSHGQRQD